MTINILVLEVINGFVKNILLQVIIIDNYMTVQYGCLRSDRLTNHSFNRVLIRGS